LRANVAVFVCRPSGIFFLDWADGSFAPASAVSEKKTPMLNGKARMSEQHVVKRDGGWAVRKAGASSDTSHHATQSDAIAAATEIAKNQKSEVVIHGEDGKIRDKNSYGNDPFPPRS
jgi:hypothetical protein